MADVFSKRKRSAVMSAIHSKHTRPEKVVRAILRIVGCEFRSHVAALPGCPDFVLPRNRTILQVKGCFWHGHYCLRGRIPKGNRAYWKAKIASNVRRDRRNDRRLRHLGWRVKSIWECRIRRSSAHKLVDLLRKSDLGSFRPHRIARHRERLTRIDVALSRLRARKGNSAKR